MRFKKIILISFIIIFSISFAIAKVEFNFSYGLSKPNLGDMGYLYSAQNNEIANFKNQGFTTITDFNFSTPDYFKNFGGELKFEISNSLWMGIEYANMNLNHIQRGNWELGKTKNSITENISADIEKFSSEYKANIIGINLYWKFTLSSLVEIEAGVGVSYLMLKDENSYSAVINDKVSYGQEYANNNIKITQNGSMKANTFGGKAGLRLNLKILKSSGIFAGVYYTYYSPKNLNGYFRYTATTTFKLSFDESEYTNSITYNGDGDYHVIIIKGDGSDIKYLRSEVKPATPGTETDEGVAKSNFSGMKAMVGVFFRL